MKFSKTYEVRFTETDRRERLTPITLYNYLQETAIEHGESAHITSEGLAAQNYAWMLNRIHLQFSDFPARKDTVTVATWASNLRGLYAIREWIMTDGRGRCCARATSRWIIIDTKKGRAVRLPDFLRERYGETPERAVDDAFERMQPIESGAIEKRFHVRVSDLDSNQHANSACYIDWCLEAAPPEVLAGFVPTAIEVTYKRESALGDGLIVTSRETAGIDSGERAFEHVIKLEDGALLTIARSSWKPCAGAGR